MCAPSPIQVRDSSSWIPEEDLTYFLGAETCIRLLLMRNDGTGQVSSGTQEGGGGLARWRTSETRKCHSGSR